MSNVVAYLKESGKFEKMTDTEVYTDIIEGYLGSCNSITDDDQVFLEENDFLGLLDDEMFLCESCGWWCPVEELIEHKGLEAICEDCVVDS